MKLLRILPLIGVAAMMCAAGPRQSYTIVTDSEGVMRRSDNGEEVSYYGTNYTAPFAYPYRALGYEGKNVREAIDRDVYHIARLGLNAFRLHLWDAELADSAGNLVQNEHLDLLDYMIAQFEKRGIDIVLTAQTNFGNGYPEKDADTGSFTYDFDKCDIHADPKARAAQERYLQQLVKHRNPYTGLTYAKDKAIIAMEINNEPCHKGEKKAVTQYIDRMSKALRKGGFDRIILYNVTHNPEVTDAYYDAKDIQGTTYQWYPTGLVAGHQRQGNFLPALENYTIPWEDTMRNYGKLARVVYEFDPADVMYSHLYPAIARTFRHKGFQWITQFAYDPIDLAQYNTEYPTHYMNLAYTPAKALSMMIAAETARETPRGAETGKYPSNLTFGHTTVSHDPDISIFNHPEKFIYTNSTDVKPVSAGTLRLVAGHGSSPIVDYTGTGAYFLDATLQPGVWRLEVMPDVTQIDDPFGNTSLNDAKMVTTSGKNSMRISLPALGDNFRYAPVADISGAADASKGVIETTPGVYLLWSGDITPDMGRLAGSKVASNVGLAEYVAPDPKRIPIGLLAPLKTGDKDLDINMIPEEWGFRFDYRSPNWYDPAYYLLETNPTRKDGVTVIRRRVADKIDRMPATLSPKEIKVSLLANDPENGYAETSCLPEGTRVAVVSRDGYTYSAPLTFAKVASTPNIPSARYEAAVSIDGLRPSAGHIMPAPYPVTVTREVPATDIPLAGGRDIEFVELIIPNGNGRYLLNEIWME